MGSFCGARKSKIAAIISTRDITSAITPAATADPATAVGLSRLHSTNAASITASTSAANSHTGAHSVNAAAAAARIRPVAMRALISVIP